MQAKKYDVIMVMSNESSYSLDERLMACFIGSLVGLCLGYIIHSASVSCASLWLWQVTASDL